MGNTTENRMMTPEEGAHFQDVAFYRFVIDSLPTAVLTVNSDFRISGFNPWAEKITGYSKKEAQGKYCGAILQGGMCMRECPLKTAMKVRRPINLIETDIVNRWGETIPVRMSTSGLFDGHGELIGGVESFHDITRLKRLEREKDNIISMFAHDMKSSLTIIGGFVLRILKKMGQIDAKKQKKYLGIIKKEAGKLESLVNEFLEFSRLQTGRLKLNLSATSLDKELMDLVDSYHVRAAESGIKLMLESEEALPVIMADTNQLRRVFTNLLDNALKFSKKKGKIIISTHETLETFEVRVKDEGIGIKHDELAYIFDSFRRGRDVDNEEGFGLGLAAVKAIVEGHGGRVLVKSELGKGSVFTVVLPKKMKRGLTI